MVKMFFNRFSKAEAEGSPVVAATTHQTEEMADSLASQWETSRFEMRDAWNHLDQGAYAEALDGFERLSKLYPTWPEVYKGLGMVYSRMGEKKWARQAYEKQRVLTPEDSEVYLRLMELYEDLEDEGAFQTMAEATLRNVGEEWLPFRIRLAVLYGKQGHPETGLTLLEESMDTYPHHGGLRQQWGFLSMALGRMDDAYRSFQTVLERDPGNGLTLYYLGQWAMRSMKPYKESRDYFMRAVATGTLAKPYLVNLSELFSERQDLEARAQVMAALQSESPNSFPLLMEQGYLWASKKVWGKAEAIFQEARRLNLSDPRPLTCLAEVYLASQQWPLAQELLETLKEADPEALFPQKGLAFLMLKQGQWQEALDIYSGLLLRYPQSTELLMDVALLYAEIQDLEKAAHYCEKLSQNENLSPRQQLSCQLLQAYLGCQAEEWLQGKAVYDRVLEQYGDPLQGPLFRDLPPFLQRWPLHYAGLLIHTSDFASAVRVCEMWHRVESTFGEDAGAQLMEDPEFLDALGQGYEGLGNDEKAFSYYEKAMAASSACGTPYPPAYVHYNQMAQRRGVTIQAVTASDQLLNQWSSEMELGAELEPEP